MLLKLLALPVTLPAAGIRFCLEKVAELADAELTDDTAVKEELLLLQLQLEEGEIGESEYRAREAELLVRLREIRERRRHAVQERIAERGAAGAGPEVVIELPDEVDR
ncbi:MAG: gas vesicle protein GvpG [Candidatus Limnocylindria bacterium]